MFALVTLALTLLTGSTLAQNTQPLRYMPFGDSITEITCWRSKLWQRLQSTEFANVNFVGSVKTDFNCGDNLYDRDSEGHTSFRAVNIANQNQLEGWLRQNPADVITMHLGTNDVADNRSVQDIINAFTKMVGQMRASNARMKIIVAQIIPLANGNQNGKVQELNRSIIPWAQGLNKTESPIWVVDQYTGFSGTGDNRDGVHPNANGDTKMTNVWFPAVVRALEAAQADRNAAATEAKREVPFQG